jgi:hypothetical protein
MTQTIEINGEKYETTDNPKLGTVRDVQSKQMSMIQNYIPEDKVGEVDLADDSEIVNVVVNEHGMDAFSEMMWEKETLETVQTISLACDECFDVEDLEEMGAQDFQNYYETAKAVLDGDASDFFERLGIGSSLKEEEMRRRAQEMSG